MGAAALRLAFIAYLAYTYWLILSRDNLSQIHPWRAWPLPPAFLWDSCT